MTSLAEITPAEAVAKLRLLRDTELFARRYWKLPSKSKGYVPAIWTRAQRILEDEYKRQEDARGFVRLNVLKCRQVGGTTWSRLHAHSFTTTRIGVTALTIAHEINLPGQWLIRCRELYDQTPEYARPKQEAVQGHQLRYATGSRYYIGSAQGGFPGVGDTIHFLHLSELGRWDKPPISIDPEAVLYPLQPAIPTGADRGGTVIIRESTGVMVGDYWYRCWTLGKDAQDEYQNVFLPWYLVAEYRRDDLAGGVLSLDGYEQALVREAKRYGIDLDHAQIAWRRNEIRQSPFFGNVELWSAEFPAYESEAFMSPGATVYTPSQVGLARETVRPPVWRGNLDRLGAPSQWHFSPHPDGECMIWEEPDDRYHYVIGADCQWGKRRDADWDVLYVECLETGRIVCKVKGHYPINVWGHKLATVGHRYNDCPVAPELNGQDAAAGQAVLPVLLGNVESWSYPNIWIRTDPDKLRGDRAIDYGWWSDPHSKSHAIAVSMSLTESGSYDWCDSGAVDQMGTIIRHEDNRLAAPEGSYDDDWMARIITGAVAHRERATTQLFVEPEPARFTFRTPSERVMDMLDGKDEYGG